MKTNSVPLYLSVFYDIAELCVLFALIITLWPPSPERDPWVLLLIPAGVIIFIRSLQERRFYGKSRFTPALILFVLLCTVSIYSAPYMTRGWVLMFRPIAGIWLMAVISERLRTLSYIITFTKYQKAFSIFPVILVVIIGITALQWTGKAAVYSEITRHFPQWQDFFWWRGGINVNEWSGAAAWVIPPLFAAAFYGTGRQIQRFPAAITAFVVSGILLLGQSLSGILGAAAGILLTITPNRWLKPALITAGIALILANFAVIALPRQSADALALFAGGRDSSLEHRAVMWERAQAMFTDHPFTGVGIAMYRQLRDVYPTPGFEREPLPHPHNEIFQFITDLGIPGAAFYCWMIILIGQSVMNIAKNGTPRERNTAVGIAAGLFAHAVYGLTDAIPVWDRFAFILWWWLGLLSGLDMRVSDRKSAPETDNARPDGRHGHTSPPLSGPEFPA